MAGHADCTLYLPGGFYVRIEQTGTRWISP